MPQLMRTAPHRSRDRLLDRAFTAATLGASLVVLGIMGATLVLLINGALPALTRFGAGFFWSPAWSPARDVYGALGAITGTVLTSLIALVLAVPVAFGIAFYLTELAPAWIRRPFAVAIDLLAAIPGIIYGMWGFFVLVPFMAKFGAPVVATSLGSLPGVGEWFRGVSNGRGILTAGLLLSIMILPFIAATMRETFSQVPPVLKEAAYGLGATTWEVARSVTIPYTRAAVGGGIMLGLGRALGETMAVTFVIGNTNRVPSTLLSPGSSIASLVALEFPEATAGSLKLSVLFALGLVLFVVSFLVLALSRWLLRPQLRG